MLATFSSRSFFFFLPWYPIAKDVCRAKRCKSQQVRLEKKLGYFGFDKRAVRLHYNLRRLPQRLNNFLLNYFLLESGVQTSNIEFTLNIYSVTVPMTTRNTESYALDT